VQHSFTDVREPEVARIPRFQSQGTCQGSWPCCSGLEPGANEPARWQSLPLHACCSHQNEHELSRSGHCEVLVLNMQFEAATSAHQCCSVGVVLFAHDCQ
jgi:hypothetical protein